MRIEIEGKKENPLLERVEVNFRVEHDGASTPTRDEIGTQLAGALGVKRETVIVDSMDPQFGRQVTIGYAKVYDSIESAKKFESDYQLARNKVEAAGNKE